MPASRYFLNYLTVKSRLVTSEPLWAIVVKDDLLLPHAPLSLSGEIPTATSRHPIEWSPSWSSHDVVVSSCSCRLAVALKNYDLLSSPSRIKVLLLSKANSGECFVRNDDAPLFLCSTNRRLSSQQHRQHQWCGSISVPKYMLLPHIYRLLRHIRGGAAPSLDHLTRISHEDHAEMILTILTICFWQQLLMVPFLRYLQAHCVLHLKKP